MEMKLVSIKGESYTEFKIPHKEKRLLISQVIALKAKGKPFKESTRYIYYILKGDYLNGKELDKENSDLKD